MGCIAKLAKLANCLASALLNDGVRVPVQDEEGCIAKLANCCPCRACSWTCGVVTAGLDWVCESSRSILVCPCWGYLLYTLALAGGAVIYAAAALLDDDIREEAAVHQGCIVLIASGSIHLFALLYIMLRFRKSLKDVGRYNDYMRGLDSSIIQEAVMAEMWQILKKDCFFKIYCVIALCTYLHAIIFAGGGDLTGLSNPFPRNAVFCLVAHMVLSLSLTCCWKAAMCCGIFCESCSSMLLPQSPPRKALDAPVELSTTDELGQTFMNQDEPKQEPEPGQQSMQAPEVQQGETSKEPSGIAM